MGGVSEKLVGYYSLPRGSRFALKRHGASARNARMIARSDVKIRRRLSATMIIPTASATLRPARYANGSRKCLHHTTSSRSSLWRRTVSEWTATRG